MNDPLNLATLGHGISSTKARLCSSKSVRYSSCPLISVRMCAHALRVSLTLATVIVAQRLIYGNAPPETVLPDDDLEQALALEDD